MRRELRQVCERVYITLLLSFNAFCLVLVVCHPAGLPTYRSSARRHQQGIAYTRVHFNSKAWIELNGSFSLKKARCI